MKKFLFKIAIFFTLSLMIDIALGHIFQYMKSHGKGGGTARMEYITSRMTDNIIIMGSSRAIHHYDPRIFIDSLGMSTFNIGLNGNGIIFNYGQFCLFKNRYSPCIIIYDIFDSFDLIELYPNERYLDALRPYYEQGGIDSIFFTIDNTERFKMLSQMRRYNGHFASIILNYFKTENNDINGYRPLVGQMDYQPTNQSKATRNKIDPLKLMYLEKLIDETNRKGIKLVFYISPIYNGGTAETYQPLIDLAYRKNVPLFNHYNDSSLIFNRKYFKDSLHLNKIGSEVYSKRIIKELRQLIK